MIIFSANSVKLILVLLNPKKGALFYKTYPIPFQKKYSAKKLLIKFSLLNKS